MIFDQIFLKSYWSGNTKIDAFITEIYVFISEKICFSLSALLSWVTKTTHSVFSWKQRASKKLFSRDWTDAKNNHGLPILEMPEFLRFLRKTITENRPFTGGGSLFESKRGEEIGPTGDWDQNSASSSTKSSCPLSIPKKVIPDGPIRLVHSIF